MSFEGVKEFWPGTGQWYFPLASKINQIMQGKTNNIGTLTLTPNVTSTVITLAKGQIGEDTYINFQPTTANAAAELAAGGMYESARSVANSTFTITHANAASADRTFRYVLIG